MRLELIRKPLLVALEKGERFQFLVFRHKPLWT